MPSTAPSWVRFSTDSVRPAGRFAYWKEAICEAFVQLELECDSRLPFQASLAARRIARFDCITVSGSAQRVSRSVALVNRDRSDNFILMRQRHGDCLAVQDGRQAHLRAGGLALVDSRRPYTLHFPHDFSQTVFRVPASILDQRLGRAERCAGRALAPGTPLGHLACQALDQLQGEARESIALPLSNAAFDLLSLALAESAPDAPAPPRMATLRVAWAKAHALDNLRDPGLDPQTIADSQGVSTRLLQRLFAAEGERLAGFILEQRLQRARDALQLPAQACRSITEVALAWGFNDPGHFTKAFRRRFGVAPRDFRAERLHGRTAQEDPSCDREQGQPGHRSGQEPVTGW